MAYYLAMVGPDMSTARESVVVFCPGSDAYTAKQVMWTLSQKHILGQYAHGRVEVAYDLYIWREEFIYTGGAMETVEIGFNKGFSLYGSPVTDGPGGIRLSTVACVLQVESGYFALTSAHPFEATIALSDDDVPLKDYEDNLPVLDGIEYDFTDTPLNKSNPTSHPKCRDIPKQFEYAQILPSCAVLRPSIDQNRTLEHQNLDWSLLEIQDTSVLRPNSFERLGPHQYRRVNSIGDEPMSRPPIQRHVQIILSHNTLSFGVMSSIPAYISNSGAPGRLCEVWTVSLTQGREIKRGDSGSLVIDQETNEAYGHVIAVNPLGVIYVVPLRDVLTQVKEMFGTTAVKLFSRSWEIQRKRQKAQDTKPPSEQLNKSIWSSISFQLPFTNMLSAFSGEVPSVPRPLTKPDRRTRKFDQSLLKFKGQK
ncbi:hypothetical protein Hte_007099 [Hypoxylon texense]